MSVLSPTSTPSTPDSGRAVSYHGAVCDFKRRLIEATLQQVRGNRTHAARVLGLQRTYLLRLIRDLGVVAPPPPPRRGAAPVRAPGFAGAPPFRRR
jgi:DNA-binding NtrC family response regulator